ncbi:uncharacterized protein LOC123538292 [Mercenaria mercenaria]|uniref:uncharacterized protein LOC123538292 n=1 Tax=Mercenaria mercenaria TaxID=6596 RepID=UPI00234EE409|nr:uncharacterized protein LOC123538292 [Mercenaria mercenaria]
MTFSLVAYALCAISNVAQSLHLLFLQRVSKNGLSPIECLHLNSINSLPFFAINVVLFGELGPILNFPYYTDPTFIVIFVMQICLGCLLTYLLILCTSMTSAVTTTVIGGLKALFQVAVGIITLGGLSNNLTTYVGLSMSTTGVVTYLISKIREKMTAKSVDLKLVTVSTENGNEMKDENVNTECDSQNEKAELKTVKLDNV